MAGYLVLGAGGQVGAELVRQLEEAGEHVHARTRAECDVGSDRALEDVFDETRPDVCFNAAAFTDVDQAESVKDRAFAVNARAVGKIASLCRTHRARLVHFSSNYVFGPGHDAPIDESAVPEPMSVYGRSKWLGERLAQQNWPRTFIIRSSAVYGAHADNFVKAMLRLAFQKKSLTLVSDEIVSPTLVDDLAAAAIDVSRCDVFGVYHAASTGACSWYEFAAAIFDQVDVEATLVETTQERWGAPARRPAYAALDNAMLRLGGLDRFVDWETSLRRFLTEHGDRLIWELS